MSVIVDDRDSLVQYKPNWATHNSKGQPLGAAVEYQSTTSVSNAPGDTATFSFEGSSIGVYATVGAAKAQGASMSFSIDQQVVGSYQAPAFNSSGPTVHHELLWMSDLLAEGPHTLVITQTEAPAEQIFLDYFLYTTTSTAGKTIFIDDNDALVKYSSSWGLASGSEEYFQNTAHQCQATGCVVSLSFEGDSLSLFGAVAAGGNGAFNAQLAIDGGSPESIQQLDIPLSPNITPNVPLFTSALPPGNHTMILTTDNSAGFFVDYFLIGSGSNVSAPATSSSIPAAGTPAAASATSSGSPSFIGSTSKSVPVAAAVGGALGGLVFLALLLVFILLWRRRRRLNRTDEIPFETPGIQWAEARQRPQSGMSMATLTGDDPDLGAQNSDAKGAEFLKSRPMSRYLYYNN